MVDLISVSLVVMGLVMLGCCFIFGDWCVEEIMGDTCFVVI